jgi:hypothetical protein
MRQAVQGYGDGLRIGEEGVVRGVDRNLHESSDHFVWAWLKVRLNIDDDDECGADCREEAGLCTYQFSV